MDDGQRSVRVLLLLADRGKNLDAAIFDLQDGLRRIAFLVPHFDAMQPLTRTSLISSAIVCFPSPARRSTQVRTRKWVPPPGGAEKFVNVALAVADVNAARGSSKSAVDCFRFSSQRMLSFFSIGTRVGLIFFLSALQPLNFFRVQNFMAASPSGSPSVVTARLECIRMPAHHVVVMRPAWSRPEWSR